MKGYKVTDRNRKKLIGIACDSLSQLITKGAQKLKITEEVVAALDDGTIVDDEDYFQALPSQTIVILYRKYEEIVTGVDYFLKVLRSVNTSYLETGWKANEFLLTKTQDLLEILKESKKQKEKIWKMTPEEDPEWFADLDTNARTKDDYMFRKSQDRIRGYLYKFQEDLRKNKIIQDSQSRKIIEDCLVFFRNQLKKDKYFGCYFDRRCATKSSDNLDCTTWLKKERKKEHEESTMSSDVFSISRTKEHKNRTKEEQEESAKTSNAIFATQVKEQKKRRKEEMVNISKKYFTVKESLQMTGEEAKKRKKEEIVGREEKGMLLSYDMCSYCDDAGEFVCQGKWMSQTCEFLTDHHINPYLSREARILFSTWNLDHRIERSRSVAPTLVRTIQSRKASQSVNFLYFYQLLFTKVNLKLVHVVCHDKGVHDVSCDPRYVYT